MEELDFENAPLIPYILGILSAKPKLCDTFENLCLEIEAELKRTNNMRFTDLQGSLQTALGLADNMGLINFSNNNVRLLFAYKIDVKNGKSDEEGQPAGGTEPVDVLEEGTSQKSKVTRIQQIRSSKKRTHSPENLAQFCMFEREYLSLNDSFEQSPSKESEEASLNKPVRSKKSKLLSADSKEDFDMEDAPLIPYILSILSNKPKLCDTFENLCLEIEAELKRTNNTQFTDLEGSLQTALGLADNMGLINFSNNNVRLLFAYKIDVKNEKSDEEGQPAGGTEPVDVLEKGTSQKSKVTRIQQIRSSKKRTHSPENLAKFCMFERESLSRPDSFELSPSEDSEALVKPDKQDI